MYGVLSFIVKLNSAAVSRAFTLDVLSNSFMSIRVSLRNWAILFNKLVWLPVEQLRQNDVIIIIFSPLVKVG